MPIFRRLGFCPTEPRELEAVDSATGTVRSLGQSSAHIMMSDTYIELSAVPDPASRNHLEPFLERYEGLHILALRGADIESSYQRMGGEGFELTGIQAAQREIGYGSRHGNARFRWFMLERSAAPEGLVCVVDNQTPELVYQRDVLTHANGASAVCGVIICSDTPGETLRRFASICGAAGKVITQDEPQLIELANASLTVMSPASLVTYYPGFTPPASPSLTGLEIHVSDMNALTAQLQAEQVEYTRTSDTQITLPLPEPANAILIFSE